MTEREGMVRVPAACFEMGSEIYVVEEPPHEVCLDAYFIGRYETTQKLFEQTMGFNPSRHRGDRLPVENVTWMEARTFCEKSGLRLPAEAEWEYAAALGKMDVFYWGAGIEDSQAWFQKNSANQTHPVGQKQPNRLGLFDMYGNVWEWVADWFGVEYYEKSPHQNPKGPPRGQNRVLRGGSFEDLPFLLRTTYRFWYPPGMRNPNLGFRCAADAS
ncbi:MAG: formylglycine-generating enzyme family protein [Nitrospinaceae bacterium]